jgi:hypothetical protein
MYTKIFNPKKLKPRMSNQKPISVAKTRVVSNLKNIKLKINDVKVKFIAKNTGGNEEMKVAWTIAIPEKIIR